MSTATKPQNLYTKLAAIRSEFGSIAKTGEMKEGPRFKYVEARAIAARFVELCAEHRLTMLPVGMEIASIRPTISQKQNTITLLMTWRITDADTGEYIDVFSVGEGSDNSDKGAPKAQTNAMKYAILLVLQAAGEDAEADIKSQKIENDFEAAGTAAERLAARRPTQPSVPQNPPVPRDAEQRPKRIAMATDALKRKIRAKGHEVGLGDFQLKAFSTVIVGKTSSSEWTMSDADLLLAQLDEPAKVDLFRDVQEVQA